MVEKQPISVKCASDSVFESLWMEMTVCGDGEVRLMFEDGNHAIYIYTKSTEEMRKILETALDMLNRWRPGRRRHE
jgi:hypothetical protein